MWSPYPTSFTPTTLTCHGPFNCSLILISVSWPSSSFCLSSPENFARLSSSHYYACLNVTCSWYFLTTLSEVHILLSLNAIILFCSLFSSYHCKYHPQNVSCTKIGPSFVFVITVPGVTMDTSAFLILSNCPDLGIVVIKQ